jgi:hypothetical protein
MVFPVLEWPVTTMFLSWSVGTGCMSELLSLIVDGGAAALLPCRLPDRSSGYGAAGHALKT